MGSESNVTTHNTIIMIIEVVNYSVPVFAIYFRYTKKWRVALTPEIVISVEK